MEATPNTRLQSDGASLEEQLGRHSRLFAERFGAGPGVRMFFSPGRVNLMGAHLDYNGGPVMPMAVHSGTFIAARPRQNRTLRLATTFGEDAQEFDLDHLPENARDSWADYPLGVARLLSADADDSCGLDLLFGGNLPIGAGLSSSASICVGTALALDALWHTQLTVQQRVNAALRAEREFVGVHCGIMDPFAVGYARPGHLLWLDCKDQSFEHLPLDPTAVRLAVVDTEVRRQLAHGAFNQRVDECQRAFVQLSKHVEGATCLRDVPIEVLQQHGAELEADVRRRAHHVLSEVERTFRARSALLSGDLALFGSQMSAAHESLARDFEVSVGELDCLVEAALKWDGVLGSRLTGAGFGGCIVVLLKADACEGFASWMIDAYRKDYGQAPALWFFEGDSGPREIELG